MPSVVGICNLALDKLGQTPITSLTDGNKSANLCDRNWPLVRDKVLREYTWNFAVKRTTTAPSSTSPIWGFTYQHPLPSDCLRLIEIKDYRPGEYQVENNHILTDDDVLYIRYVAQITDTGQYDDLFVEAIAARLAYELAEALTQSNTKRDMAWQEYQDALNRAKVIDAQENPPSAFIEDDWVLARY